MKLLFSNKSYFLNLYTDLIFFYISVEAMFDEDKLIAPAESIL